MTISIQSGHVPSRRNLDANAAAVRARGPSIPRGPRAIGLLGLFGLLAATACGSGANAAGPAGPPSDNPETLDAASNDSGSPGDPDAVRSGDGSLVNLDSGAGTGTDAHVQAGDSGGDVTLGPDAGAGHDAGTTPGTDAGAPGADAGNADAATPGADAGHPGTDAGTTPGQDAGAGHDAGTTPGTDAGGTAGGGDAGTDASSTGGPSACVAALPAGWSLAAFNTGLDSCPTGFAEHVVLGPPAIGAGACSCSCSVTQPGACGQGSLAMSTNPGHGNDACTTPWFTATVNGSQCIAVPAAAQDALGNFEATALAATGQGGTCGGAVQSNPASLSEPPERFCDVPAASADAVCNGTVPTGFSACIIATGQVACPSSTPFVHPFTVEDGATLACGSCSACSVSTSCSNPMVEAFTNATCAAPAALTFAVNGTCVTNPNEETVLSIEYTSTTSATCTPGTSSGTSQLTGPRTICCR
jgi:hypothetical protein